MKWSVTDLLGLGAGSGRSRPREGVYVEWGTVGWEDDATPVDFGPGWDDGMTLVKVTLFRGRRPGFGRLKPGVAAGMPILAHLDATLYVAPPAGTRVCVVFPGGDCETPANGIIVAVAAKSPAAGFDAATMQLPVPDGWKLKIGDAQARALAHSDEVAADMSALSQLAGAITTFAEALKLVLSQMVAGYGSLTGAQVTAWNGAVTAIEGAVTATQNTLSNEAGTLPTTKAEGT